MIDVVGMVCGSKLLSKDDDLLGPWYIKWDFILTLPCVVWFHI